MSEFVLGMLVGGGIVAGSLLLARWLAPGPRPPSQMIPQETVRDAAASRRRRAPGSGR